MIFVPTKNRLENVKRFIAAYHNTEAVEPVILLVNEGEITYDNIDLPLNFSIEKYPATCVSEILNMAFKAHPDEKYYACLADDVVPETMYWDITLSNSCFECQSIVWADDNLQKNNLPTHPFIYGDLVRKIGYLAHPQLKHWFVDNVWLLISQIFGGIYRGDVKLPHYHFLNGKAIEDDTYKNQPSHERDLEVYQTIATKLIQDLYKIKNEDRIFQG